MNQDNVNSKINIEELERGINNTAPIEVTKSPSFVEMLEKVVSDIPESGGNFNNSIIDISSNVQPQPQPQPQPQSQPRVEKNSNENQTSQLMSDSNLMNSRDIQPPRESYGMEESTLEQQKHDRIKNVMSDMGIQSVGYNMDKEKREDQKSSMLEEIEFLREELLEYNYKLDSVHIVNQDSSYETIESTLRHLRHKMDRVMSCEFAESFILMAAYGLEDVFDGKKNWFGYTPDLTGWSNSVQIKLRRMRHTTSQMVSQVMFDYGVSPGMRLAMELIPSAVLHSRMRKNEVNNTFLNAKQDGSRRNPHIRQFGMSADSARENLNSL